MTPEQIRTELIRPIATWTTTPVAWPNIIYDPGDTNVYIRPRIGLGETVSGELPSEGVDLNFGVFFIDILVKKGMGIATASSYAGYFQRTYRKKSLNGVETDVPVISHYGVDSDTNRYQIVVKIPFWTFINE